jgi:hypothetical protein
MPFQGWVTNVDYLEFDADPSGNGASTNFERARPNLGMRDGKPYLKALGQPANTVAGNVADQPVGTLAVPAISINVIGTITLTNALVTANSLIFLTPRKVGTDSSTARGPVCWVDALSAGSATIGVKAQGVAISVSIYVVHYLIIN